VKKILDFLAREPIGVAEAVRNTLIALVGFNVVVMTEDQLLILMAALGSILALAARASSTPNIKINGGAVG
jgi:hypothetical protein